MNMQNELQSRIQAWDKREASRKVETREEARARAAKARAAYKRRQVRDNALLFPLKVVLIAANMLVPLMLAFAAAMLLLSPLFLLIAALRPLVIVAGLITTIIGLVTVINGGSPVALIVGAVLTFLALTVKVTYSNR